MLEILIFCAAVAGVALALSFWRRYRTLKARLFRTVRRELNRVHLDMERLGAATAESARAFAQQMELVRELCGRQGGLR